MSLSVGFFIERFRFRVLADNKKRERVEGNKGFKEYSEHKWIFIFKY